MKKFLIGIFFSIIILFPAITLLAPKESFSDIENRTLAKPPKLSQESIKNKSFMNDTESYLADHIVLRNEFVKNKTKMELLTGKREINNIFITPKRLMENVKFNSTTQANTASAVKAINNFSNKYKDSMSINMMLVPTAVEFYKDELPLLAQAESQTAYVKDFYSKLKNVNCIDAYASLSAASADDIFYRTDHHWTSYGAYIGYTALGKSLGYKPVTHDMFNVEHISHNFLGTLYSKAIYGEDLKDSIDIYRFAQGDPVVDVKKFTGHNTQTYSSILFKENLEKKDKYTVFLGENDPVVTIKTDIKNGKKLLLFKDSYANSLMQFLPLHYEEITLVDLRFINRSLSDYIDITQYNQALFLYNVATFSNDSSVKKINLY